MGKYVAAGTIGFLLGTKFGKCGRKMCMKYLRKQALKILSL